MEKTEKQGNNEYAHNSDEGQHNRRQESIAEGACPIGEETSSACNSRYDIENESGYGEEREPGTETAIDEEHCNDYKSWRDQPYNEADKILEGTESALLNCWRLSTHPFISLLETTQVYSLRDFSLPPAVRKWFCLDAGCAACGRTACIQT